MAYKLMILNKPTTVEVYADHDDDFTTYHLSATVRGANVETEVEIDNDSDDDLTPRVVIDAIIEAYIDHLEDEIAKRDERIIEAQLETEGNLI